MTNSLPRQAIVDTLIDALETERYARAPLLLTVMDELQLLRLESAVDYANRFLAALDEGSVADDDFLRGVDKLRSLVTSAAR